MFCVYAVHGLTVMHILAVGGPPCIDDRGSLGGEYELSAGDTVRVDLDLETTKLMQEGHGGWDDAMADVNTTLTCTCMIGGLELTYSSSLGISFTGGATEAAQLGWAECCYSLKVITCSV